ncbi:prolyl oligopeptidase family serine peptidase [Gramella sp. AN32]|uniref:Prolyl oligopeptidase family serine peptidase n=1 Tax=Christiangramia antarctica TaxID=2058158 RepID=A0ABW5X4W9_9FLAO|nr:prolyl oligopeptidase family serine peptidase [Gramella sp. AN32]MCM4156987.1 alpha/beta hydrolase [Gramella sp. AN32]
MRIKISCFIYLLIFSSFLYSQNKEGNIVQYFGKEKVENIDEGKVVHLFKEGLILKKRNLSFTPHSVDKDPFFARIIAAGESNIYEGKTEIDEFSDKILEWEKIEAGENSQFEDPLLRSGYLYLEYESESKKTVLFEASGHTLALINGLPHEGDHYDFGWSLIPIQLKKGKNEFVLSGGRFSNMRARLLKANSPVQFTERDMTLPDLLRENQEPIMGGIRVMNTNNNWLKGAKIFARIGDAEIETPIPPVSPLNIRKVTFQIPVPEELTNNDVTNVILQLKNKAGKVVDIDTIELAVKSKFKHHKKTFISDIDGSVQYYSMAPSLDQNTENQAMFLSVHGASVEAVNQANAYKQKDWGHIVAPTNRRPFGFAWEDWGRLDALEVLTHAEELLKTDPQHTYLTGHSMGGHGTWYLGATYPDRFAAIAPAAGYPDLLEYRQNFIRRMLGASEEEFAKMGTTKADFLRMTTSTLENETDIDLDSIIRRAGNPSRTLKMLNNYLHFGVYVLHGEVDSVVPTSIARNMRERLGKFHNDFAYFEYPNGTHWYGNESVDWPPIFEFFKARHIKSPGSIDEIEFATASPGVSAGSHFVSILQQEKPFEISSFRFNRNEQNISVGTHNVATLKVDAQKMGLSTLDTIFIDDQDIALPSNVGDNIYFRKENDSWKLSKAPSAWEKGPHRNGGFKDAFRNNVMFVYASNGTAEENEWYYNRARFDAEKFWYRANGNIELVKDTDFNPSNYSNQNVIIYGNKDNNSAWNGLLKDSPIQVSNNKIMFGDKSLQGDQWGAYFIYPRKDSESASIGVVTATGNNGMRGAYANDYLVNGTSFPDLLIFDNKMMKEGVSGVKASGFFGNSWSIKNGDFIWRE